MDPAPGRLVYRPAFSRVCFGFYLAFAGWWLLDVLAAGRPGELLSTGAGLLAVGSVLHAVFWRPAVIVDGDGVLLVNVLRDVRVPWAALEGVETRYALALQVGTRRIRSWAAAAPGRPLTGARLPDPRWVPDAPVDRSSRDLQADSGAAAFMVEQSWAAWRERTGAALGGTPPPIGVRLNLRGLAVGATSVVILGLAALR
jgi:hypothetical protein